MKNADEESGLTSPDVPSPVAGQLLSEAIPVRRSLAAFRPTGYDKGRSVVAQLAWFAVMNVIFMKWWCPPALRPRLLRMFGADIGRAVFIRHRVRILWPWKLTIADDVWIGEGVWLLNLEPISIEADVCLSQEAFLCCGSHDAAAKDFGFDNGPIRVEAGAWVAARATVLRGVTIGRGAVVAAGSVVSRDVRPGAVHR